MSKRKLTSLLILLGFIFSGCAASPLAGFTPSAYFSLNQDVSISVVSPSVFQISNDTEAPIYTMIFPTELLPLIDWAPCETLETCAGTGIPAGNSREFNFETFVDGDTDLLTIFWWQLDGDQGHLNPNYFFPQIIDFPVP
jgi:hypothetical protein